MTGTIEEPIRFKSKKLDPGTLLALYRAMLTPRMIEEKMLKLLRQGKVSKWFSGIGQEAIATGATMALKPDELIFPLHRNLGVFTNRNVPLERLFCQWQGKNAGFTKGRDRSFHFGTTEYGIVGMISHLGPQLALACGAALGYKLRGEPKVAVAFTGEGGTSEGDFHEALNIAAVWELPVIFLIENNGYGLSTPISEQFKCKHLADKGKGYGMEAITIDGNNILQVYRTIKKAAEKMRKYPAPILVECMTFRRRGHEEASGTKYVPTELMTYWEQKDPVINYENYLREEGILTDEIYQSMHKEITDEIEKALVYASGQPLVTPDQSIELDDVYHKSVQTLHQPTGKTKELRFVDAIRDGLDVALQRHRNLILMGQDIAEYGGVFKVTEGLMEKHGRDRVRNTPLCESAILGAAVGLSITGYKSMVEMQFADFVTCGFNQIVNNAAKLHYRWGQNVDTVIRMPTGAGVGAGPFHSQTNEAWFFHVPGLKIVYPSTPEDAKGLLLAAFEDPNPVLYFEHKALYRNLEGQVPEGFYTVPIGQARLVRSGSEASIITYGMGVHWAEKYVDENGMDIEILDLRSLQPLDYDAIANTVRKTGRVLVLHEDNKMGGIGGEIAAWIGEYLFEYLDAPVLREGSLDTPVPFASDLEQQYLPVNRIGTQIEKLLGY
ncbi:MAG TPA: dehydrogenase E1 component subunit alpha/beta [Saprospiraceae bacterium]|nr:dehydrogenase E1 component subunit alpha/beta [Saprospiraceae bacterium]